MKNQSLDFLAGGGEMGALMRTHDWSSSSLGLPETWPQSLRTVVRLMLNTGHPMYVWWGRELACLYNDAYRTSIGSERHPRSLGMPAKAVWAEIWPIIGPQIDQVMSGRGATWNVDQLVPITRHGRLEDVYWTYSYSPIDEESAPGGLGGVLVLCSETTANVLATRHLAMERDRLEQLFVQAPTFMALLEGPTHIIAIANPAYMQLVGHRAVLGKTVAEALPDTAGQGYLTLLDEVFATGKPYNASGARYEIPSLAGMPVQERFLDFVYQPIKDASERVTGIFVVGADVTERTRAFASLAESEARFRAALRAGGMGSWETNRVDRRRLWSQEGMALFGLDLVDGQGTLGGPDDEYVAALHPDDRHLAHRFAELAERQDSFAADYRVVRPDGTTVWLSGGGLVVERSADGRPVRLVSVMGDVTEARKTEQRLSTERERLRLALSAGKMGAYELDMLQDTLWWSPETYELFGLDPDHFVPTRESVTALLHPDDRDVFVQRRAEAIRQHLPFFDEFRIRRPDGSQIWIAYRGQVEYDDRGRPARTFGTVMDVTERRKAEDVLRQADRDKDDFIAILSHELRNPLAPIRNAVGALKRLDPSDPRVSHCHDVIARQTGLMARLLDDLLDVSRLTRRQVKLQMEGLDLAATIDRAVEIARPSIESAGHELAISLPSQPVSVNGDPIRLAQIFSNVLINAAKYTPSNGHIALTATLDADQVSVKIRDTGIGIGEEHLGQIFELFGQVESARSRSQGGQGIGLSLARGLVELHGGSIQARSDGVGKGSEFEVRLPIDSPA